MYDKKEKRNIIGQYIDIDGERYRDNEIDILMEVVSRRYELNGKCFKKDHIPRSDYGSDGKYRVFERDVYTFVYETKIYVKWYHRRQFDGDKPEEYDVIIGKGHEIARIYSSFFK